MSSPVVGLMGIRLMYIVLEAVDLGDAISMTWFVCIRDNSDSEATVVCFLGPSAPH